ncbi:hypothetical protein WN944_028783 [Citrus x changshan-huyou]|uniref:Uncharacterized protein n=1 Tax=Citrus x changshan-huyou TaxID=2935761 RepID=A0AAP0QB55_9ROSI
MVAVKSFEDTSSEVIANWFSHPSGNPNSSAGNLGVRKLMFTRERQKLCPNLLRGSSGLPVSKEISLFVALRPANPWMSKKLLAAWKILSGFQESVLDTTTALEINP